MASTATGAWGMGQMRPSTTSGMDTSGYWGVHVHMRHIGILKSRYFRWVGLALVLMLGSCGGAPAKVLIGHPHSTPVAVPSLPQGVPANPYLGDVGSGLWLRSLAFDGGLLRVTPVGAADSSATAPALATVKSAFTDASPGGDGPITVGLAHVTLSAKLRGSLPGQLSSASWVGIVTLNTPTALGCPYIVPSSGPPVPASPPIARDSPPVEVLIADSGLGGRVLEYTSATHPPCGPASGFLSPTLRFAVEQISEPWTLTFVNGHPVSLAVAVPSCGSRAASGTAAPPGYSWMALTSMPVGFRCGALSLMTSVPWSSGAIPGHAALGPLFRGKVSAPPAWWWNT